MPRECAFAVEFRDPRRRITISAASHTTACRATPETYLQPTAGSQQHFSLANVLPPVHF